MATEIVYVCSPDRRQQLLNSLNALFNSGTSFDRVVIFCVSESGRTLSFRDPRIVVEPVPPLFGRYFYGNKTYLCTREAERVVFLDTDTFALRPLDAIWEGRDVDLVARVATAYGKPAWKRELWLEALRERGAGEVPMFNAGMLVFQGGAQRRIHAAWLDGIRRYLSGELVAPWHDLRMYEQFALALAAGASGLRFDLCGRRQHAFGWEDELYEDALLLHTGGRYDALLARLERDPALRRVLVPVVEARWSFARRSISQRLRRGLRGAKEGLRARLPAPLWSLLRRVAGRIG